MIRIRPPIVARNRPIFRIGIEHTEFARHHVRRASLPEFRRRLRGVRTFARGNDLLRDGFELAGRTRIVRIVTNELRNILLLFISVKPINNNIYRQYRKASLFI
jgi:hypothetical protein